jgi:AcrR family transcriptional regulator
MKTEKVDNTEITAENKAAPKRNTKEAILEEATELFYEVGYARTTIRDVAGRLGIPNPSIYYYFKNKEYLLFEVIESCGLDVVKELEVAVNQIEDPLEKLANMISRHISLNIRKRKKHKVFIEEGYHLSGKLYDRLIFLNRQIYNYYYYQIKLLGEKELLKTSEYSVLTFMLLGTINWVYRWYKEEGELSLEQISDIMISSIFGGMINSPGDHIALASARGELGSR